MENICIFYLIICSKVIPFKEIHLFVCAATFAGESKVQLLPHFQQSFLLHKKADENIMIFALTTT